MKRREFIMVSCSVEAPNAATVAIIMVASFATKAGCPPKSRLTAITPP
jgi:hypothetical protein